MISRWLLLVCCLILALTLPPSTHAKSHDPNLDPYELEDKLSGMFYFEDTDTVLMSLLNGNLLRSTDAGKSWTVDNSRNAKRIYQHPFNNNTAYILGRDQRHWITTDQGESWSSFEIPGIPAGVDYAPHGPFSFHGRDPSKVIFEVKECDQCSAVKSHYTKDDFRKIDVLGESAAGCVWAVGNRGFANDLDVPEAINDRVLCVAYGLKDRSRHGNRLVFSDNYFGSDGIEIKLQNGRPVSGVTSVAAIKKFLVAAVESKGTSERALYVSIDTNIWHRAEFDGHRVERDSYTILESTDYSLQVNVLSPHSREMGTLFTSNSNGTYFKRNIEHTNCNLDSYVDFEKIDNIQGIVLVNIVTNSEDVESGAKKQVVSKISFDDGRTFQDLKFDHEALHLHSVTTASNFGRVFSSPAPGIVMGVGNTGDYLKEYSEGDLYVSDDAGLNWRFAQKGPHLYEIGDQGGIIMAIKDSREKTKKIQYSLDHGKNWKDADLEHKVSPSALTTTPDSSSLKFILYGSYGESLEKSIVYSIDFEGLHERKCEPDDFEEKWPARLDEKREPDCLMGHKQFFKRRKASAECFVAEKFNDSWLTFEPCKCTAEDFECDYKQTEDGKACVLPKPLTPQEGQCQKPTDTFIGSSGWRLVPGNNCIREGGESLDKDIERPCEDVGSGSDGITHTAQVFNAGGFHYYYMERQASNSGSDETVMMRTSEQEFWVSYDHGKNWKQPLEGEEIAAIVRHPGTSDVAFLLTNGTDGFWTIDNGRTFRPFKAKIHPNRASIHGTLKFHRFNRDWLIWIGSPDSESTNCPFDAYVSTDRGDSWDILRRCVKTCTFEGSDHRPDSDYLVYCEGYEEENPNKRLQLYSSNKSTYNDWGIPLPFKDEDVVAYAEQSEFIIVASHDPKSPDKEALKAWVSVDGKIFAEANFPSNIVPIQTSYTTLDSSTHAVFLYVTSKNDVGFKYGSIVKSNSNGTSYVLSLDAVNQNDRGFVDFERSEVLEGVMIANIVSNVKELSGGVSKRLRTMITHNDGGEWALLPPPLANADGEKFKCSVVEGSGTEQCSLHLHGYTERKDDRDTFSSGSAIGLMLALGNVGDQLSKEEDPDTFITWDGGVSWKCVKKGPYIWEYGDSGSVIVIVPDSKPTKVLYYSTDEGNQWLEYEFTKEEVLVKDISTVPSDTSKNFILWTKKTDLDDKFTAVNIDFTGLNARQCKLDEAQSKDDDYYLWEPKHPFQDDNCIFGHVEQYHRKKPSAKCWNNWLEPHLHSVGKNCSCTRGDYECDYNYERQSDGSCALVPGLEKQDASTYCKEHPDAIEYWEKTGYRRIPQTTCEGGQILDHIVPHPCPGKQEEYDRKHGISGVGLFFAIVIPIAVAGTVGYYVYTRWDGKFGQIRLGETASTSQGLLSRDSLLVTIPITIIAGVVAVAKALPLLGSSLWRSTNGYLSLGRRRNHSRPYASRAAFAARRGDYTSVVDDEDELLGVEDAELEDEDEI